MAYGFPRKPGSQADLRVMVARAPFKTLFNNMAGRDTSPNTKKVDKFSADL
jgi:hypothetical protein